VVSFGGTAATDFSVDEFTQKSVAAVPPKLTTVAPERLVAGIVTRTSPGGRPAVTAEGGGGGGGVRGGDMAGVAGGMGAERVGSAGAGFGGGGVRQEVGRCGAAETHDRRAEEVGAGDRDQDVAGGRPRADVEGGDGRGGVAVGVLAGRAGGRGAVGAGHGHVDRAGRGGGQGGGGLGGLGGGPGGGEGGGDQHLWGGGGGP